MSHRPHIIHFQHICSDASLFCKDQVPHYCPNCRQYIQDYKTEPFAIPYPLGNAKDHPCTVVVRPANGRFLNDYLENDDLHIGLTDSTGKVVEFDKCGLVHNDVEKWKDVLVISLIPTSWESLWDDTLKMICSESQWNSISYNEENFNCFNFVISFLQKLNYINIKVKSKEDICETFILPKIKHIIKYINLYRALLISDIYIEQ